MTRSERSARTRYIWVFILSLAALLTWIPDVRRDFGHPLGDPGLTFDYSGAVIDVAPQAAAAGVKAGDRIDLRDMTPGQRLIVFDTQTLDAGTVASVPLTTHGRRYIAHIKTVPEVPNVPVVVLRQLGALLVMVLGIFLVLKRPNIATWAFFVFCLNAGGPVNIFLITGPEWFRPIALIFEQIVTWVPVFFGAIFALHLLHDGPLPRWRAFVEKIVYGAMVFTTLCGLAWAVGLAYFGVIWEAGQVIAFVGSSVAFLAIPVILLATYSESRGAARERLRWVIWAFLIGAAALIADTFGSQGNLGFYVTTYFEHSVLTLLYSVLPVAAVVYAILKHRIIDINVAISRAVVYAALSTIVVGLFALVDMFFTSALSNGRIGLMADMGLALILGFSFNAMHARVDRFMDWLFFRTRHLAEEHVATVASAIPYARNEEHVNRMLIDEPVRAFDLAESELVRVVDDVQLKPVHRARGHGPHVPVSDAESLIAILKAQRKPWRLVEQHMAVAIPIFSDNELEAIAFYAPHTNGTDIDNDELGLIERAAVAAGAAYARFRAAALQKRVAQLQEENSRLKSATTA